MINVVAAFIENQSGQLFIARRKLGKELEGFWEFPGGKIELGESPESSLKRELFEEFGLNCEIKEFVGESVFDYPKFRIRLLGFRVLIISGEFYLVDHDEFRWVNIDDVENYKLAPADFPLLEYYRSCRGSSQ
jgi:8-oxo-dGTP diphosphatase